MSDFLSSLPDFHCFREYADPPQIIPGRADRDWMDATASRFAYRCTPLPIANASGWEIILPMSFTATWTGGASTSDVKIVSTDGNPRLGQVVSSVFGHGILTFHPGYLFRTSPGWAICARGAPNTIKDGIAPLEGLVETDWLPFTFTMNWRFTRPTGARFERGESFCFLSLVPHALLDAIQPKIRDFADDPALKGAYDAWRQSRTDFQARVAGGEPEALKQGWQRGYAQGREPSGASEPLFHLSRRRLKAPR
ncbi:DUF6065 family protein [Methylocapsa sp. S129]|uniref:DUF6065 family protein n=1 Tax=Methylocapsa sp. S129 TaxID=1641869 RepID=UPI00131E5F60|nr:DUF6065 family protein [Methylocapsa sp. S129]